MACRVDLSLQAVPCIYIRRLLHAAVNIVFLCASAGAFIDFPIDTMVLVGLTRPYGIDIVFKWTISNATFASGSIPSKAGVGGQQYGLGETPCIYCFVPIRLTTCVVAFCA